MVDSFMIEQLSDNLVSAIETCKHTLCRKETVISYYLEDYDEKKKQFIVMIKPEVFTIAKEKYKMIVCKLLEMMNDFGIDINATYVMDGTYLKSKNLMEKQYSVLNAGARLGLTSLNKDLKIKLSEKYNGKDIVGAYEFLQNYPNVTANALEQISHARGSQKEGNGLYIFEYEEYNAAILNAFHPHQIEHFYRKDSCIVVFVCSSDQDYKLIQENLIGHYDPKKANQNSMRNYVYENNNFFGLNNVSIFYNCFHISPSPLEGMYAVYRYCNDGLEKHFSYENTILGTLLLKNGYTLEDVDALKKNPFIKSVGASLFDLLESMPDETASILCDVESIRKEMI